MELTNYYSSNLLQRQETSTKVHIPHLLQKDNNNNIPAEVKVVMSLKMINNFGKI